MEKHVRNQQPNMGSEPEKNDHGLQPGSGPIQVENLAQTEKEIENIKSISDIVQAIKSGDKETSGCLIQVAEKIDQICDQFSDIQLRIANIETSLEQLQLSNITIFDKLAKIAMALVAFVAKFGTKKDEAEAEAGVEAEKDKS